MVNFNQSTGNSVTDVENAHNHEGPSRDVQYSLSSPGSIFFLTAQNHRRHRGIFQENPQEHLGVREPGHG